MQQEKFWSDSERDFSLKRKPWSGGESSPGFAVHGQGKEAEASGSPEGNLSSNTRECGWRAWGEGTIWGSAEGIMGVGSQ